MFTTFYPDPENAFMQDRLARVADDVRSLNLSTREEYQAEVYSRVNAVLALGNGMTPLSPITPQGPALVGDVEANFDSLNRDSADIASQILLVEDIASQLFNLTATSQNSLRQQIRENILHSTNKRFLVPFINTQQLDTVNANIDVNVGVATLPLTSEVSLLNQATISVGVNSIGTVSTDIADLTDGEVDTALVLDGSLLELIITFPTPQILNRLRLYMDDYEGLEITSLTCSSDGAATSDILADLGIRTIYLNGTQGKYSGDFILDFTPRYVLSMRLLIADRVGQSRIALREIDLLSRKFGSSGSISTTPILQPSGSVQFSTIQTVPAPYTSITHQISYNGVTYTSINPGDLLTLTQVPFWYRAILERSVAAFSSPASPVASINSDPLQNASYILGTSQSTPLGANLIERQLLFTSVNGPIPLREVPLPGTLQVQAGALLLTSADYAFSGGILSFATTWTNITVTYQTSALASAALTSLVDYYTPLLYQAQFQSTS
jgi:hypothetical protein